MIRIHKACVKEIGKFPSEIKEDLSDALARLSEGHRLSMPLSRTMPSLGFGVHELRLRSRDGIFRVIYFIKKSEDIWLVHAFQKKGQSTPQKSIKLAKKRIKETHYE